MGEPPSLPAEFWHEQPMRDALAERSLQAVLRLYLACTGLTQEAAALLIGTDQGTVSKIFTGRRSRYTIEDVESFRDGFRIPGRLLGLQPGRHERRTPVGPATGPVQRGGDEPTKRRDFNKAVLLAALGTSGATGDAFLSAEPPRTIGMEHVRMLEHSLVRLEGQDALMGGDALCDVAAWLFRRAYRCLQEASYSLEVGEALQSAIGELGAWVGWMAYDANRHAKARHHFQETLLFARMNEDPPLEVRVLSYMSMQSVRQKRPREAVQIAKTAQRIASGWATPRLQALLYLRAARAYAATGNQTAFLRELSKSKSQFECGPHVDDPLFIKFLTAGEVAGITALSYLDLSEPERASDLLRSAAADPDQNSRRNATLFTVRLAEARLRSGDVTEAAELGLESMAVTSSLDSARTRGHLRDLRDLASLHLMTSSKATDFIEHHDAIFGVQEPHA